MAKIKKFTKGDRVIMVHSDNFAAAGSIGTIVESGHIGSSRVAWERGPAFWHTNKRLELLDEKTNEQPNLAFKIRKRKVLKWTTPNSRSAIE